MDPKLLSSLPVGTIVKLDDEEGEIVQAGIQVRIIWPETGVQQIIYPDTPAWKTFIEWLTYEPS
jgi:hypothetical protein